LRPGAQEIGRRRRSERLISAASHSASRLSRSMVEIVSARPPARAIFKS